MREPFALELHRRFLNGESAEQLSAELEIPVDRIELRLRAAAINLKERQEECEPMETALAKLGQFLPRRTT